MAFDTVSAGFAVVWPLIYCYFATFATSQIMSIDMAIYDSLWYNYSLDLRKYTILILARSQQPVFFTGFNLIRCNLESFALVGIEGYSENDS